MENYEYLAEGATPQVNIPFYTGWGFFLDLFGQQTMRGPLRLQRGQVWAPSLTFEADNRTGIFSPEPYTIGYAIFGFLRFLVSDAGTTFYNVAGFGGTVAADLLTENQIYQLPDRSGTLALETSIESTTATNVTKNVSNFADVVLTANPLRLGFQIVNNGDVDAYVGFSDDLVAGDIAVADGGFLVTAKGGSYQLETIRYTGPIYAITQASSTTLSVVEYLP